MYDAASQPVAVARRDAVGAGHSDAALYAALRRGEVVRPLHGAYVDPARALAPDAFYRYPRADAAVAAAYAALAVLPPGSAIADETAGLVLCGLWPPDSRPRVLVPAPATCTRRPGAIVREGVLGEDDVIVVDGLRTTSGTRTGLDLARRTSRPAGLVALDALLHARVTTTSLLVAGLSRWAGHRGVLRARALVDLADGRAESPGESRIRLALLDAGLGPVELQVPVCGGRFRVDLVVRGRVAIEFEGRHHEEPGVQLADRPRFNALGGLPYARVLRYGSRDLSRLGAVVAEVRAALIC
ncbi:MAG: endonuclease domain-containing protein [Mycobacteriales bacterium]